jgi:two-component system, chemotaxis family, chemotaxis protein CheY
VARILVVDDAAFMRTVLKKILTEAGHEVVSEATDGVDAIVKYAECRPDLVTMDITMPKMDGVQALKAIRGTDGNARVIMCSAMGQESLVVEAISNGARDFVAKPFEADRVVEAVAKALA